MNWAAVMVVIAGFCAYVLLRIYNNRFPGGF